MGEEKYLDLLELEKRVSRLEKLVLIAIVTNLPQLLRILFSL